MEPTNNIINGFQQSEDNAGYSKSFNGGDTADFEESDEFEFEGRESGVTVERSESLLNTVNFSNDDFNDDDDDDDDFVNGDFNDDDDDDDDFISNSSGTLVDGLNTLTGTVSSDFNDDFDNDDDVVSSRGERIDNIIQADVINDSEIRLDVSLEEFENGMLLADTSVLDDPDLISFNSMVETLSVKGYEGLESVDYNVLQELQSREDALENVAFSTNPANLETILADTSKDSKSKCVEIVKAFALESVARMIHILAQSNATLQQSESALSPEAMRNSVNSIFNSPESLAIYNLASGLIAQGKDVDANYIFDTMVNSKQFNNADMEAQDNLLAWINELIPVIKAQNDLALENEKNESVARNHVAHLIAADEIKEVSQFNQTPNEKFEFIKNVYRVGADFEAKCPVCGERIPITNLPIRQIGFLESNSRLAESSRFYIPVPLECKCETKLLFTIDEYASMEAEVVNSYKLSTTKRSNLSLLESSQQQLANLCHGASYLLINPVADLLEYAIVPLIREGEINHQTKPVVSEKVEVHCEVNNTEIEEAAKRFYSRLKLFKKPVRSTVVRQMSDSAASVSENSSDYTVGRLAIGEVQTSEEPKCALSYREIAIYMANVLSIDYSSIKNQAIFSLLFSWVENPIFNEILSLDKITALRNEITILKNSVGRKLNVMPQSEISILSNILLKSQTIIRSYENYTKLTDDMMLDIPEVVAEFEERLQSLEVARKEVLQFIDKHRDAFGYTKIMNLSNFKLSTFDSFITDDSILNLVNYVSDLMIINNLAGDFYQKWSLFKVLNANTQKKSLTVKAKQVQAFDSMCNQLGKRCAAYDVSESLDTWYLKAFIKPAVEEHKCFRNIFSAIQNVDYYAFCKGVNALPMRVDSYVSLELNSALLRAREQVLSSDVLNMLNAPEYEFYLSEFSKEELAEYDGDLNLLTFGRLIPHRLEGEDINTYVRRYQKAVKEETLTEYNSHNVMEYFNAVRESVCVFVALSLFSRIGYSSYSTSVFMVRSIMELNKKGSRELMFHFLNLNENLLNLLCNSEEPLDAKSFEFDVTKDFQRIISAFAVSGASMFTSKLYTAYQQVIMLADDHLNQTMAMHSKVEYLDELFNCIRESDKLSLDNKVSDAEGMLQELSSFSDGSAVKSLIEEA